MHIPGSSIVLRLVKPMLRLYFNPERIKAGISVAPHRSRPQITVSRDRPSQLNGVCLQIANQLGVRVAVRFMSVEVHFGDRYLGMINVPFDQVVKRRSNETVELKMDLPDRSAETLHGARVGHLWLRRGQMGVRVLDNEFTIPMPVEMELITEVIDAY